MPPKANVSDTELAILKVLWDLEEATVREVLDALTGRGRDWAYTTVQTFLSRLQEKGFVESRKVGRAYAFRPAASRDDLVGQSLEDLAERVCDGAAMPLLINLVQSGSFGREEIEHFRKMLDELDEGGECCSPGSSRTRSWFRHSPASSPSSACSTASGPRSATCSGRRSRSSSAFGSRWSRAITRIRSVSAARS